MYINIDKMKNEMIVAVVPVAGNSFSNKNDTNDASDGSDRAISI